MLIGGLVAVLVLAGQLARASPAPALPSDGFPSHVGTPRNDTLQARNGLRDFVDCGAGRDTAYVDRIDVVRHCERVLRK